MVHPRGRYFVLRPTPIIADRPQQYHWDVFGRLDKNDFRPGGFLPPELQAIPLRYGSAVSAAAPRLGDLAQADQFTAAVRSVVETIAPTVGYEARLMTPPEQQAAAARQQGIVVQPAPGQSWFLPGLIGIAIGILAARQAGRRR